jgi:hypothetical protein
MRIDICETDVAKWSFWVVPASFAAVVLRWEPTRLPVANYVLTLMVPQGIGSDFFRRTADETSTSIRFAFYSQITDFPGVEFIFSAVVVSPPCPRSSQSIRGHQGFSIFRLPDLNLRLFSRHTATLFTTKFRRCSATHRALS